MSYLLSPICNDQQCDANGNPLVGGKIYTYIAGSSTPAATYTDNLSGTQQANPIVLNSLGLPNSPIWMTSGIALKFVIQDFSGVTIRTVDNVSGINDISSLSQSEWVPSNLTPTYISASSFSFAGDQTPIFTAGRRIQTVNTGGTVYATIVTSVFTTLTTITVAVDSGTLDSGLSSVAYSLLNAAHPSVPGALILSSVNGGQLAGLRNRIINGGMQVGQRGSTVFSTTNNLYGWVDRWLVSISGTTVSALGYQDPASPTSTGYALQVGNVTTTGATVISISQRIEALNSRSLNGKTVTISGKVYQTTGAAQTLTFNVNKATAGVDNWGTQAVIGSSSLSIPDSTWTAFTYTVTLGAADATNGISFVAGYNSLGGVTNKQFLFGDCQLEIGSVATPFEQRPYGMELALCQRYLPAFVSTSTTDQICSGYTSNTSAGVVFFDYVVQPRVAPSGVAPSSVAAFTFASSAGGSSVSTSINFANGSTKRMALTITGTGTPYTANQPAVLFANTSGASLLFTGCEL